MVKATAQPDK